MNKQWVILCVMIACLLSAVSCMASHLVAGEYDLVTRRWTWEVSGSHALANRLSIGYSLRCLCSEWVWKAGIVPSWVPIRQDYTVWAEARHGPWSVRLTDWCDHWLSQSGMPPWADEWGLTLRVQREW